MGDRVERVATDPAGTDRHDQLVAALEERRAASVEQQARLIIALSEVAALLEAHRPADPTRVSRAR